MNDPIPLSQPRLEEAEIAAAIRVLRRGHLVQGPEVASFEQEFAALVNGRDCIAVNSGTTALWLSLLALGIGPGDEVIVPSFTFTATAAAIAITGATYTFAEIDPGSFCLDPDAAAAAITPRTAVIIPVHLYGHPAAMDRLVPLARHHGLALIEDAAQAHAAALHGQPTGTFGELAGFSFYPTKNLRAIEGGMITTADPALARTLRLLRNQGMATRHAPEIMGTNARMSDVSAAIAREQLRTLATRTHTRRCHAARLDGALASLPGITIPPVAPGARHVYHQYTIRVRQPLDRDVMAQALHHHGISSAVHYPIPLHRTPAYLTPLDLPHTDAACTQVLSVPVHPALTDAHVDHIATVIAALAQHREPAP